MKRPWRRAWAAQAGRVRRAEQALTQGDRGRPAVFVYIGLEAARDGEDHPGDGDRQLNQEPLRDTLGGAGGQA